MNEMKKSPYQTAGEWRMAKNMKNKDYIKGFAHGVSWTLTMVKAKFYNWINQEELNTIKTDSKKAIKSLKEGR